MDNLLAPHTPEATAHNHIAYVMLICFSWLIHWVILFPARTLSLGIQTNLPSTSLLLRDARLIVPLNATSAEKIYSSCHGQAQSWRASCQSHRFHSPWHKNINVTQLFRRRYSYDAIHNAIASSRSPLQTGGYSRVSSNCGLFHIYVVPDAGNVGMSSGREINTGRYKYWR